MLFLKSARNVFITKISPASILFTDNLVALYSHDSVYRSPLKKSGLYVRLPVVGRNPLPVRFYSHGKSFHRKLSQGAPQANGETTAEETVEVPGKAASSLLNISRTPTFDAALTTLIGLGLGIFDSLLCIKIITHDCSLSRGNCLLGMVQNKCFV